MEEIQIQLFFREKKKINQPRNYTDKTRKNKKLTPAKNEKPKQKPQKYRTTDLESKIRTSNPNPHPHHNELKPSLQHPRPNTTKPHRTQGHKHTRSNRNFSPKKFKKNPRNETSASALSKEGRRRSGRESERTESSKAGAASALLCSAPRGLLFARSLEASRDFSCEFPFFFLFSLLLAIKFPDFFLKRE